MRSELRKNKAFLLLEVMFAMVMVTSGLLFVGRIYSLARGAMERSRALFVSSLLLEEKMFDLQSSDGRYESAEGLFPDHKGCYWNVDMAALTGEEPQLFRADISVFLPSGKSSSDEYRLETLLIKNKPEGSE